MSGNVSVRAKSVKSGHTPERVPIPPKRGSISSVMQKVRSLLPAKKAAFHLAISLDWDIKRCEKLLSGERRENQDELADLLRSEFGREVLFVVMGDARPEWFGKYRKQLDLNEARKRLIESQRAIDALQMECSK